MSFKIPLKTPSGTKNKKKTCQQIMKINYRNSIFNLKIIKNKAKKKKRKKLNK